MPVVADADVSTKEWEEFYHSHTAIPIFQSPDMYQVYARTKGLTPDVIFFVESGTIRGSLLSVRQVWGRGVVARRLSRFLIQAGPQGETAAIASLLKTHKRIAATKSVFSEIRPILPDPPLQRMARLCGFRWEPHLNYLVDLSRGEAELWSSMSKSRRKNIRAAEKSGLSIHNVDGRGGVLRLHGLVQESYSRAGLPAPDLTLFEAAYDILGSCGGWLGLVVCEGKTPIAARAVLVSNGVLHDWYAGSSDRGRNLHADEWLVWEILKRGIAESRRMFDFGGAGGLEETYGPGEFKRRFGGHEVRPGRMIAVHRPVEYFMGRAAWKAMSRIRRG